MYIKGARRENLAVHKIDKALGDGHYQLSRDGTVVQNEAGTAVIYLEEKLVSCSLGCSSRILYLR